MGLVTRPALLVDHYYDDCWICRKRRSGGGGAGVDRGCIQRDAKPTPDTSVLIPLALIIGITQVIRGALQLGRNFGAELLAQKLERSIRDELYLSLLGNSMTFHNLQPIGDTMARATNDVR